MGKPPFFASLLDAFWSLCSCPRTCSSASNICSLTPIAPATVPEPLPAPTMSDLGSAAGPDGDDRNLHAALMVQTSEKFVGGERCNVVAKAPTMFLSGSGRQSLRALSQVASSRERTSSVLEEASGCIR